VLSRKGPTYLLSSATILLLESRTTTTGYRSLLPLAFPPPLFLISIPTATSSTISRVGFDNSLSYHKISKPPSIEAIFPQQYDTPTMPKFQAIVLSLVLGRPSAAGCYPAYSTVGSYSVGSGVSSAVSATTPIVYTACTVGTSGCSAGGWLVTGGVTTTTTYNYVCNSPFWCSNSGYAPGGIYSDLAWTKEAAACSVSSPAALDAHRTSPLSIASSGVVVERRVLRVFSLQHPLILSNPTMPSTSPRP
jgi:hypothetical protein